MAITESRLKGGSITIDALVFSSQPNSIELEPSTDEEGDQIEVLSGETIDPEEISSWELNLGVIQDFDDPDGLVEFARANAGEVVPFILKPNAGVLTYEGTVRVRAIKIGGTVNTRLLSEVTWPVITGPTPDYGP